MKNAHAKRTTAVTRTGTRTPKEIRLRNKGATWSALSPSELSRPGATLLALILEAANTRGLGARELAEDALGVSYSYFASLRNGEKEITKIGDDVITRIAKFLGLPKVAVMLAAGQLKLEDFYQDPEIFQTHLQPALQFIQRDPNVGAHMPASVFTADPAIQQFVVILYEKAYGKTLIPSKVSLEEIAKRYKNLIDGGTPTK